MSASPLFKYNPQRVDPTKLEAVTLGRSDLLDRLLSPADAALRAKVLTDLLEYPAHDPDVVSTRKRIAEQLWVKATLGAHNGDGTWTTLQPATGFSQLDLYLLGLLGPAEVT